MLGFLKKKLKEAVSGVKKKIIVEREGKTEERKKQLGKLRKKIKEKIIKKISEREFEDIFFPFEMALLENNVALEVVEKIKQDLKKEFVGKEGRLKKTLEKVLLESLDSLLLEGKFNLPKKSPFVVMFVGVNGVGKTTSMAKFAYFLKKKGKTCVFSASDTFRAASIEQLEKHAKKLGLKVIKHDYGADAAAVAFDAIKYAEKHNIGFVLVDTAGRMHSNRNLMDELKKIKRVAKPDFTFFVGDSLTGNDAVNQAKTFEEEIGFDGIILTKADVDQKGGAIISVSYVTKKPIYFLGMGQEYGDLKQFRKKEILKKII